MCCHRIEICNKILTMSFFAWSNLKLVKYSTSKVEIFKVWTSICSLQLQTACTVVVACAVFHNMCISAGDMEPGEGDSTDGNFFDDVPEIHVNHDVGGSAIRTALINHHFC